MEYDHHQQQPERSQSTTSLNRMYHGTNGGYAHDETHDPSLDFCNAFWGLDGKKGYDAIMTRLQVSARTVDELRAFWKERAAIEEDYAKRLSKLAKLPLGKDEVGDLKASLQTIQAETAAQASYHLQLSTELHQTVEQPTAEFGNRLANLKKGLQASVEKSWRSKAMHEGHVAKARKRYEDDCLMLNSYTANMQLTQGKELEKLQSKIERVRQTIGSNESDFKNFVSVLETGTQKWENDWKAFCDYVQDLEEDRLSITKDIAWAYANAVSQVCVEDDSSCERVREKLEAFEPLTDMVNFARGWGTGSQIPDPPRFINYGAGEYPTSATSHIAQFQRLSAKPEPLQRSTAPRPTVTEETPREETKPDQPPHGLGQTAQSPVQTQSPRTPELQIPPVPAKAQDPADGMRGLTLRDEPIRGASADPPKGAYGGVAMPGMANNGAGAAPPIPDFHAPESFTSFNIPPKAATAAAAPPSPSARDVEDNEDPMARALAQLRHNPPAPGVVRRGQSQRRMDGGSLPQRNDSLSGASGAAAAAVVGGVAGAGAYAAANQFQRSASPAPGTGTGSQGYQRSASPAPSAAPQGSQVGSVYGSQVGSQAGPPPGHITHGSIDSGLFPPQGGHTAKALAQSKADFERKSQNPQQNRGSVNYTGYGSDVVGQHPTSRPASRASARSARSPSPGAAMMQPPTQPATHIADQVIPRYHQSFPGEKSRSRPSSMYSATSRPGSFIEPPQSQQPAREGFVGIGTGNAARSPSPRPSSFRAPSPGPGRGGLGPQNLGISLDERGGVAHDSMAEEYRREYQQRQQSQPQHQSPQPQHQDHRGSYGGSYSSHQQQHQQPQQQQQQPPPQSQSPPAQWRSQVPANHQASLSQSSFSAPFSAQLGGPQQPQQQQQYGQQPDYYGQQQAQQAPQVQHQQQHQQQQQQPPFQQQQQHQQPPQQQQQFNQYGQPQHPQQQGGYAQQSYQSSAASYNPNPAYGQHLQQQRQPPQAQQPQHQQAYYPEQNGFGANASPQPAHQQQGYQQQQPKARTPSPQPNRPPEVLQPTGEWASNGKPVQFYVTALYDYQAQSPAEFDFQVGDIIAVTDMPDDGWWSGELLDVSRRDPGRTDFPSNFVKLF